jgi:hypothetical protein
MTTKLTTLDHPIDAMYLIHNALRVEAARVQQAANQLEMGGSFKPFTQVFYRWVMALGYHAALEDRYVTTRLPDAAPAREHELGHQRILEMMEDLQTYLQEELRRTMVIARTKRQVWKQVMLLLLAQEDILEEEEESMLPVLRHQLSPAQQLELVQHLLLDQESEEAGWMLDWITQNLTATERQLLADLEARFAVALPRTI